MIIRAIIRRHHKSQMYKPRTRCQLLCDAFQEGPDDISICCNDICGCMAKIIGYPKAGFGGTLDSAGWQFKYIFGGQSSLFVIPAVRNPGWDRLDSKNNSFL